MVFRTIAVKGEFRTACELLAEGASLSRIRIKDAMQKGAVWLTRQGTSEKRLRRASAVLRAGDVVTLYYDAQLLACIPPRAECRHDADRFSLWFKPAGLMTQGSRFGDHCSLLRQAERFLRPGRGAYLVHRLDREACGLVLIAHDREAAGAFSRMFAARRIVKRYRIEICGRIGPEGDSGRIDRPIDGKPAITDYTVVSHDPATGSSVVDVVMQTGRRHQIRRHFALAGVPVMGDPLYGKGNKNRSGLKLAACGLEFTCPFTGRSMVFRLDPVQAESP
jgi:tRNA pseudouridine32 synthase/23S rRNA pseudouridine746 synthase